MTTANAVLSLAASKIGTGESPPNSNRNEFTEWYGMTGPWCAMFVSWVMARAGQPIPATTSKGFAYCPSGIAYLERIGRFHTSNPQPGDMVFFRFAGEAAGRSNHVGFVEKVLGPRTIQTIEGNTQDRVMRRSRNTSTVVGYGRPSYGAAVSPPPADAARPGSSVPPVVAVLGTKSGAGYWTVASDGGVFSYGDASFYGSLGGQALNAPIVGASRTPSGEGYALVAADGGVFNFGDSMFFGSMGGQPMNAPVVDLELTPSGLGYWIVGADRGVFSFGDAGFHGSGVG